MRPFEQPLLSDNPEHLSNRLGNVKCALSFWKDEGRAQEYDKEFIDKNIGYFQVQRDNIFKKLSKYSKKDQDETL